jgi:DUF2939 family protein
VRRLFAALLVLAVLAFGAAYFASPAYALYQLKQAAEAQDRDKLEALIDFHAVRENLKRQVDSEVTKAARAARDGGWSPLEAIGKLGSLWGDRKIRKLIEPGAIQKMLASGELKPRFSYLTLDRVRVRLERPGEADVPLTLIMDRRGVFGWQVTKIELPGQGD